MHKLVSAKGGDIDIIKEDTTSSHLNLTQHLAHGKCLSHW